MDKKIAEYRLLMKKARQRGHWKAFNDAKKHYDRLIARSRKMDG